ncbi:MAG: DEAD/DEAH box helicase family protein [Anaerolineae bacterium]|nr:DEAD/DEAH box helicase family protein [Anaerolineae bacterium]
MSSVIGGSNKQDIEQLIKNHNRRLQLLKEQKALQGYSTDPKVTLEIEDIEQELKRLHDEYDRLRAAEKGELPPEAELKLLMEGNLADYSNAKHQETIAWLSAHYNLPANNIKILQTVPANSFFLFIAVPTALLDDFLADYEQDPSLAQESKIQNIEVVHRERPLLTSQEILLELENIEIRLDEVATKLIVEEDRHHIAENHRNIINVGDMVQLSNGQTARVINITNLFGQSYADVFVEPNGPTQRVPVSNLRPISDPLAAFGAGQITPAPLFMARLAALQLKAMLTQQGVLSAANFRITPLPHQVLAVDFVMNLLRPRALIADEVGLGKTIEAALIYEEFKLRGQARRAIIITPSGLRHQWQDELAQKFGEKFVIYDRAMVNALREIHGSETNLWRQNDQIITSLDFIKPQRLRPGLSERERERREIHNRRIFQDIIEAGWDVAIVDEAHKLSKQADGTETARYQVGEDLAQAVPTFLLLSATPHQGDAARFLHLLNLVDPYAFNQVTDLQPDRVSTVVWRTRKRAAVDAQGRRLFKQRVTDIYPVDRSGPDHALERQLYDEVTDYVSENYNRAMGRGDRAFGFLMLLFQRMVTSSSQAIYDSLSKRLEKLVAVQTSLASKAGEQNGYGSRSTIYDEDETADEDAQAVVDNLIASSGVVNEEELTHEIAIIRKLLDLADQAKVSPDAKMVALLNIIDEVCRREGNPQTKFLIFTEFVATQQAIVQTLTNLGYKVERIYGGQKMEDRIAARQRFADEAQFLVSTDAGGEGINLQFCHVMVNYDLPWNPMKLEQRIGRLDRIGQTHDVLVLNLLIQDTAEQRVREVLETKLDLIRQQYGDDKLADILSTLQDEFHFDRLYMDALLKRQAEAQALDRLAEQIFERAKEILEKDDLLLPQTQAEVEQYRQRLVEVSQERVKAMLSGYLTGHGETLNEYTRRSGTYYFDLPGDQDGAKSRYSNIVFDREQAVADDGLTYLHLNHPVIQEILAQLANDQTPAAAQLRVPADALPSNLPHPPDLFLWAIYRLRMTNHDDVDQQELISIAIDGAGKNHKRLGQALLKLPSTQVEATFIPPSAMDLPLLAAQARQLAEAQAGDRFSETQLAHAEKLTTQRSNIERYYKQQEIAVSQIAIENIRQAKHRELLERRHNDLTALDRRQTLVPELSLVGLAVVQTKNGDRR